MSQPLFLTLRLESINVKLVVNDFKKRRMIMKKKLIVTDIDGTLVNDQKEIMPETKGELKRLIAQGHRVVLCSGRSINGLKDYLMTLGLWARPNEYAITFNGGNIYNLATMESIDAHYLSTDQAIEADRLAKKLKVGDTLVAASQKSYAVNSQMNAQALEDIRDSQLVPIETNNYDFLEGENIQKCLWTDEPDRITTVAQKIPAKYCDEFQIVRSGPIFLEFLPQDSSKGNAVHHLAQRLNIDLKDVIVFGDEENDLSMFKVAGTAVAMRNARDEIKEYADQITVADHNHDGIGKTLKVMFE